MVPLALSLLASSQARWLAARQKTIAENVAQSDTPGFRAADLKPFSEVLNRTGLGMAATNAGHIVDANRFDKAIVKRDAHSWDITHSGNTVSLDEQMLKSSEVHRAYALNNAISRAFSRMMTASVKA